MKNWENLTWTCHFCGEERPDNKITVRSYDISAEYNLPSGTVKENVRYCSDRTKCREASFTYRHTLPRELRGKD